MSRLKLNITELNLQVMAFFMLFIPGMYYRELWSSSYPGAWWSLESRKTASFWDATSFHKSFFCIIAGLMLFNVILLILEIFNDDRKFNIFISSVSPILTVVLLFIFNLVLEQKSDDYWSIVYPANWLFYVELFMLAAVFVTALLKCSNRVTKNQDAEVQA